MVFTILQKMIRWLEDSENLLGRMVVMCPIVEIPELRGRDYPDLFHEVLRMKLKDPFRQGLRITALRS